MKFEFYKKIIHIIYFYKLSLLSESFKYHKVSSDKFINVGTFIALMTFFPE